MLRSVQIPVCIFAKPPVAGAVKTRLIPALGAEAAAALARAMLLDTWQVVSSLAEARPVLATTARQGDWPMVVADADLWLQGEGDLGQRIERILTRGVHEAGAAIALGADSPGLTVRHIESALRALEDADAVVGPCMDGGFYLLGLRRCPADLFRELLWSCAETLPALRERLREHGFRTVDLPTLFDIDTPTDLDLLAGPEPIGAATREWYRDYRTRLHPCV